MAATAPLTAANREQAKLACERGHRFLRQGEYERAVSLLRRAARIDATNSQAARLLEEAKAGARASPRYCSRCYHYHTNCVCSSSPAAGSAEGSAGQGASNPRPGGHAAAGVGAGAGAGVGTGTRAAGAHVPAPQEGAGGTPRAPAWQARAQHAWETVRTFEIHPAYRSRWHILLMAILVVAALRLSNGGALLGPNAVGGRAPYPYRQPDQQFYSDGNNHPREPPRPGFKTSARRSGRGAGGATGAAAGGRDAQEDGSGSGSGQRRGKRQQSSQAQAQQQQGWSFGGSSLFGGLPGDISYRSESAGFYFPIVSCILFSVVGNAVLAMCGRRRPT